MLSTTIRSIGKNSVVQQKDMILIPVKTRILVVGFLLLFTFGKKEKSRPISNKKTITSIAISVLIQGINTIILPINTKITTMNKKTII